MNGKCPEKKKNVYTREDLHFFCFFFIIILLKLILFFEPIILKMYNMIIMLTYEENNIELTALNNFID